MPIKTLSLCLMQIEPSLLERISTAFDAAEEIVVTNHLNPDGDAVGSALALAALLQAHQKSVHLIMPNPFPKNLSWMKGADQSMFYDRQQSQAKQLIDRADLIVHLDYNHLKRSGDMEAALQQSPAQKMVIDHHQQPDDFADILVSDAAMSSTSEMIYHLLMALEWQAYVDTAIAEALYTGIATDTGNFRFSSTTAQTHQAASFLLQCGTRSERVAQMVYDTNHPGRLKLLSRALDAMEVLPQYKAAILSLSEEDLEACDYQKGDTEGFVNYGLSLAGIECSIFVYRREGFVKMSFRSKSTFDVNAFARQYFGGGGHLNAAGARSDLELPATIEKLKKALAQEADTLQQSIA